MSASTKSAVITLALLSAYGAVFGCRSRRDAPPSFRSSADTSGAVEASADDSAAIDGQALVQGTRGERDEASGAAKGSDGGRLPPLPATRELVGLAVPGFGDAVVSVPVGARRARPVMLAVHGNYDSPDFQCGMWRSMVHDRGFILCPRGVARRDSPGPDDIRYTYEGKFAARTKGSSRRSSTPRSPPSESVSAPGWIRGQ